MVSDSWSNTKHNSLINVLAINSRGDIFMYSNDFSGIEKIVNAIVMAVEIAKVNFPTIYSNNSIIETTKNKLY